MAIEAERLLAIFEARFTSLEKALQKAKAQSKDTFTSVEADGSRAEDALANIGKRGTPGIDKAAKSVRIMRGETGNLAAQFNDIGVQLAGGQSPFLIALQQGTQINQVLGQAGAKGAVAALGGAFISLINPVSLATIAIIAGGGYAAQYFLSVVNGGEKSAKTLKDEADLIQKVVEKWGDALPALKAYNDERERLANQKQVDEATAIEVGRQWELAKTAVSSLNDEFAGTTDILNALGETDAVNKFMADFVALRAAVADQTATTEQAKQVQNEFANILDGRSVPSLDGFISILGDLVRALDLATDAQARLNREAAAKNGRPEFGGTGGPRRYSRGGRPSVALPDAAPTPDRAPNREDVGAENDRRAARATRQANRGQRLTADDRIKEDIQNVKDRTAALKAETEMVGLSYGEQQRRSMALDLEQEALKRLHEEAARKGQKDLDAIKLSPDQVAAIDAASEAYARQADILRKVQENQRDAEQAAGEFYDTFKGGIIDAITGAEDFKDALSDVLKKLGDLLLNAAFDSLFAPASGSSAGGSFGNIFGAIGKFITGSFASGTNSAPGGPALINENGGEIVDLPKGSRVYPHDLSMKMVKAGNAAGAQIAYSPTYNFSGTSQELADFRRETARDKAEFSARVIKTVRQAQSSRMLG